MFEKSKIIVEKTKKNFLYFSNLAESGEDSENLTENRADFRQGLIHGIIQYT